MGQMYDSGGTNRRLVVARYTSSGILDTTFNGNGYSVLLPAGISMSYGSAVAVQPDGKIVVTGNCSGIDGSPDLLVARYNTNGTLDTSFGGGSGYVRLDRDGTATQTSESGNEVVIQPLDGKIVVVGGYAVGASPSDVLVVRLNSNGTLDSGFGSGGFKIGSLSPELEANQGVYGQSVALLTNGSIVVSGSGNWSPAGSSELQYYHPLLMQFSGATVTPVAGGAMAASNTNPQVIADPPPTVLGAPGKTSDVKSPFAGAVPIPWFSGSTANNGSVSLQQVQSKVRTTDDFMSVLGLAFEQPKASVSVGRITDVASTKSINRSAGVDTEIQDHDIDDLIGLVAHDLRR